MQLFLYMNLCFYLCRHSFRSAFFCSKKGGANIFVHIVYVKSLVFGDEFLALKVTVKVSSTLTQSINYF